MTNNLINRRGQEPEPTRTTVRLPDASVSQRFQGWGPKF
jgi:hypothetical protein